MGEPTPVQLLHLQTIGSSHERSQAFGLKPQNAPDLYRLSDEALKELLLRNARLCAQAAPVMEMLYEQLAHAQSMVLLADASGTVLHALGDPGFTERARRVALMPGTRWAEADKGTNAIGTALMTEASTLVHGEEHFLRALHFLTCSAAPIFDHKGELMGVIEVSGDKRSYHPHTLALVGMAAMLIEQQWFGERFRNHAQLQLHASPAGLGTLHEGLMALGDEGQILGVNRRVPALLGLPAAVLRRESVASLLGLGMTQLIDDMDRVEPLLVQLPLHPGRADPPFGALNVKLSCRRSPLRGASSTPLSAESLWTRPAAPARLANLLPAAPAMRFGDAGAEAFCAAPEHSALHGSAMLVGGLNLPLQGQATSRAQPLRETEAQAIRAAVRAAAGNLSLAARQLGIGRSTLYRKLRQTQVE